MPSAATDRLFGLTTSVAVKAPCRTVATSNITLSGLQTVNGVSLAEDDRVLVTAQSSGVDNGIYLASSGAWQRAPDFDGARDAVQGTQIPIVRNGAQTALYEVATANPITIGTTAITFTLRYSANLQYDITLAEIAAGVTPVNYAYAPLYVDRYGVNTTPGTTDMSSAIGAARDVAEAMGGGAVMFLGTTYYSSAQIRMGNFVRFVGSGSSPSVLTFGDGVAGRKDILWETSGGVYVFGTRIENLRIITGTASARAVYATGAHQGCGLLHVTIQNVNQVGAEFGSAGGPARLEHDDVWITGGSSDPITTTIDSNALATDTVIPVAATTGFSVGMYVSVELDNMSLGERHHSTVASVSSGVSITLNDAIPTDASIGRVVKASRIGMVINNGAINRVGTLDVEGAALTPFDVGLAMLAGHLDARELHFEDVKTGVLFAQSTDGGRSNHIGVMTGGSISGTPDMWCIMPLFQGRVLVDGAYASAGWRYLNRRIPELSGNLLPKPYDYTSPITIPATYGEGTTFTSNHRIDFASNWLNRAVRRNFNINSNGRIYALLVGSDADLDAIGIGQSYNGAGAYEMVFGCADTVGGGLTEKLRIGKNRNTSALPLVVPSYTVAGVPSAATAAQIIYVSNEAGGAVLAFSDGTNWLRVTDRAVVS